VAGLGDILFVPVTGADELPILPGIARALLSRTVGPAKGVRLPSYPLDDAFPDLLVWVEPVRAYLRIAQRHATRPSGEVL
jgi:hypothetical protein